MAEPAKKSNPSDEVILPVDGWRLEATAPLGEKPVEEPALKDSRSRDSAFGETDNGLIAHDGSPADDAGVRAFPDDSKQIRDLAFALALRQTGLVTEAQLAVATRDWTAFGTITLAEHAISRRLTSQTQVSELRRVADSLINQARRVRARSNNSRDTDPQTELINALNPDGRLASLLGLMGRATLVRGELEDRRVGARYTLLRKLGQGGLGTVWLARDENLNRYVAVKELIGDKRHGEIALDHFRREAEITGRLEHPGIVPVYQFGRDDKSGKAFYAMRFLGRRTLQDAIEEYHERRELGAEDKMSLHRLLTSFVSVCHAIGHAHAQKVIHRDLKPSNVALDEFGQVTLLDWGLSKVNDETGMYRLADRTEPGDLHDMSSGSAGRVIGTPLYMAPEQAAGRLEDVDELTDVYGLGGILYAILTGVGPHQAVANSTDTAIGREQFLSRIVAGEVVAPKNRVPGVQPELNAICLKALSNRRYQRYQSATELAEDIERYTAGSPVQAYEAPLKRQLSRWMESHPTLAQMLLLSFSLVVIAGIAIGMTAREGRQRLVQARFASARETTRDLEVNLEFEARALERDLHFITELPLMNAITQAQISLKEQAEASSSDGSDSADKPASSDPIKKRTTPPPPGDLGPIDFNLQTPEQWLHRQGELFDGFLNANPSYLMMASCIQENDEEIRELVRSERVSAGQRAKRVPKRQLKTSTCSLHPSDSEMLTFLRPGGALLITNDQFDGDIPSNNLSPLVLSGVAPIYDVEGEFFGINVIELDLGERLRNLIPAIAPEYVSVLVTDASGHIIMDYRDGRFITVSGTESITDVFPELSDVFASESTIRQFGDEQTYFAKLVDLGASAARAKVGIVTHIKAKP